MEIIYKKFPSGSSVKPIAGVYRLTINDLFIYIGGTKNLRGRLNQWKEAFLKGKHHHKNQLMNQLTSVIETVRFDIIEIINHNPSIELIKKREDYYLQQQISNPYLLNVCQSTTTNKWRKLNR